MFTGTLHTQGMRRKDAESRIKKWNQLYNQAVEVNPTKARISTIGSEPQLSEIWGGGEGKMGDLIQLFFKLLLLSENRYKMLKHYIKIAGVPV